jgi:hypothetical protein
LGQRGYRWRRTALLVGGVALAATLVVMLDVLGRSFADVATVPFRNLGADLIVQRNACWPRFQTLRIMRESKSTKFLMCRPTTWTLRDGSL